MPSMPNKPCPSPRCHKMVTRAGRCEDHQVEPWLSSKGKSTAERGYGWKWKKVRLVALSRDSYLCQECQRNGALSKATEVDHILNKARGGDDSLDNLESICKPCHKVKTNNERRR
jgi:5-methylcytosine-specific restriction protein A